MFSKYHWAGPLLLGIFFILGYLCPAAVADDNIRAEVATIIRENYVEPVSTDVLTAPTVKEMLKRLATLCPPSHPGGGQEPDTLTAIYRGGDLHNGREGAGPG